MTSILKYIGAQPNPRTLPHLLPDRMLPGIPALIKTDHLIWSTAVLKRKWSKDARQVIEGAFDNADADRWHQRMDWYGMQRRSKIGDMYRNLQRHRTCFSCDSTAFLYGPRPPVTPYTVDRGLQADDHVIIWIRITAFCLFVYKAHRPTSSEYYF